MPSKQEDDRNPDSLPDSTDPNGPCPRCGRVSVFKAAASYFLKTKAIYLTGIGEKFAYPVEQVTALECAGCRQGVVVVEENNDPADPKWKGIFWWPTPGSTVSTDVPATVAESFGEGMRCLSAGAPNGAAAMFRNTLSSIVEDKGSSTVKAKNDLKDKLKQMVAEGIINDGLGEWVDHVRLYGNAGVHPESFAPVDKDEAADLSRLVHTLLEVLYVVPADIARRRAQRLPKS